MLVDDLRSVAPNKLDRVAVERPDMTLEPDAVRQKDGDFNSVIAKVLQEHVLKGRGALDRHVLCSRKHLQRMLPQLTQTICVATMDTFEGDSTATALIFADSLTADPHVPDGQFVPVILPSSWYGSIPPVQRKSKTALSR